MGRVLPVLVAVVTLVVFAPVLSNGFIDWDDGANFVRNEAYRGFGWDQIRWMATTFHRGVYQPLAWLLAAAEYQIGGPDAWAYHAGSWLLHAIAGVLLYALAQRFYRGLSPEHDVLRAAAAAIAALLWAVHPLRVETVAWASAQGYPLATVCALGSILAWLRARDVRTSGFPSTPRWHVASLALAVCAYLAKPVAVTLPAVIVLLDWYLSPRSARWRFGPALRGALPYAIPAALVAAAAPLARATLGTSASGSYSMVDRLAQASYGTTYYLMKTLIPTKLTVFTPLPRPMDAFEVRFLVAAAAVAVAGLLVWMAAARIKGLAAAALAYAVLLAPVLGIIRQGDQLVADRYSYFGGIPLSLAMGAGLLMAAARVSARSRYGLVLVVLLAVVGLGVSAWRLTHVWRDAGTLWTHAAAVGPTSYQAHTNLGLYELSQGRYDTALRAFDTAIALNPASSNARFDRGLALAKSGRPTEAIAAYRAGLLLDPTDATARAHLGELLGTLGRWSEAEAEYRTAIELIAHPDLHNSLGIVLAEQDRLNEAAAAFREALRLDPAHPDASANLAMALELLTRHEGPARAPDPAAAGTTR